MNNGWIGVDLDGTLAEYSGWQGESVIGRPIPIMMSRVKGWIFQGIEVRIVTARACVASQIPYVHKWLTDNGLPELQVTCSKDFDMICLYDDRAIQVESNTGKIIGRDFYAGSNS